MVNYSNTQSIKRESMWAQSNNGVPLLVAGVEPAGCLSSDE